MEILTIDRIIPNSSNPRTIKDDKFKKLVKSIQEFPEMLKIRPIVLNKDLVVLGGNMRLKAIIEAGIKEVPVIIASGLTPEQEKEFVIKDNLNYGIWDWDQLSTDPWEMELLLDWGIDLPGWKQDPNLDSIDLNSLEDLANTKIPDQEDVLQKIKIRFTDEEYEIILNGLIELDENINTALLKLLNIDTNEEG